MAKISYPRWLTSKTMALPKFRRRPVGAPLWEKATVGGPLAGRRIVLCTTSTLPFALTGDTGMYVYGPNVAHWVAS